MFRQRKRRIFRQSQKPPNFRYLRRSSAVLLHFAKLTAERGGIVVGMVGEPLIDFARVFSTLQKHQRMSLGIGCKDLIRRQHLGTFRCCKSIVKPLC